MICYTFFMVSVVAGAGAVLAAPTPVVAVAAGGRTPQPVYQDTERRIALTYCTGPTQR